MNASNPLLIYVSVWTLVLALTSLRMTANLHPINHGTLILVGSNIATFLIWFMLIPEPKMRASEAILRARLLEAMPFLNKFLGIISTVWLIGTVVEVTLCKGVPLFWALREGFGHDYTSFGIPTLHGFLNSLFFFSITARFLRFLVLRNTLDLVITVALLFWPVMMLGRGILLGALCQTTGLYLVLNPIGFKTSLKLVALVLGVVWMFGAIGDLRGTSNPFDYLIVDEYRWVFSSLSSGFLWFYVYMTSPLGNVIYNVEVIQPSWFPNFSICNLVPTAIRDIINPDGVAHNFIFVDNNLNVSTFYAGYLSDFGLYGAILIVGFLQFLITVVYRTAQQRQVSGLMAYSVLFQCVVFSVFYDLFTIQVYIFQLLLAVLFESQLRRYRREAFWRSRNQLLRTPQHTRLEACLR